MHLISKPNDMQTNSHILQLQSTFLKPQIKTPWNQQKMDQNS